MSSVIESSKAGWSARATQYAQSNLHKAGDDLKKLLALARPTWSDICLDMGTGAGHTAAALAPHVRSVLGIDPSEGMLRQAMASYGNLNNLEFAYGYAHDSNQQSESFDLITVRHTAHHFPSIAKFLAEAKGCLNPVGAWSS
ncbi:MAG: class I SAM-dependent methyltransferase [Deinococcales bacterium]